MKQWVILAVATLVGLSGCITEGDDLPPADSGDNMSVEPTVVELPDDISESMDVVAGVDPFNFAGLGICSQEVSTCFEYPFSVNATGPNATNVSVSMDAALTWTLPASDFDLYLFKGDEQVEVSGETPPVTEESLSLTIGTGDYRLIVVAWAVVQDTYTLEATFAET